MAKRTQKSLTEQAASLAGVRRAALPFHVEPALAESASAPPAGDKWLHEIKLDGYRMFCRKEGHVVRFLSRTNQDWTHRFRLIVEEATTLQGENVLMDGEMVVTLPDGRTSFQALQAALSERKSNMVVFYAFDLLHLDGYGLAGVKLEDRKELLQRLIGESGASRIVYCDHIVGHGAEVFEQAARMGVEGIISKRRDSRYQKGRTSCWKKTKCIQSDDFVIGGYTEPTSAVYGIGSILVGQFDPKGRLVYAGRVGTGFSDATRRALVTEFRRSSVKASPFAELPAGEGGKDVRFVKPTLVAHVQYLERTGANNVLRHAVFRGLREDTLASEVIATRETVGKRQPRRAAPVMPAAVEDLPEIRFTHPDKLIFPDEGITKLDLAKYYLHVAQWMLPHIAGRPLSLVRCPEGIHGQCFFQKRPPTGLAEHVRRIQVPSSEEGSKIGMMVDDLAGLLSLVQIYAAEIHTWGARADRLDRPDRLVFDLDPHESVPWERVKQAAFDLRKLLTQMNLQSFLLATGGKGLHIVVPVARRYAWDQLKGFSHEVANRFAAQWPKSFTTNASLAARKGRIYLDYLRNRRGATFIAPYSTRARAGASVAVPLAWKELANLRSAAEYSQQNLLQRRTSLRSCPWSGIREVQQALKGLDITSGRG